MTLEQEFAFWTSKSRDQRLPCHIEGVEEDTEATASVRLRTIGEGVRQLRCASECLSQHFWSVFLLAYWQRKSTAILGAAVGSLSIEDKGPTSSASLHFGSNGSEKKEWSEWSGTEWHGLARSGMDWDGMELNGMESNGTE